MTPFLVVAAMALAISGGVVPMTEPMVLGALPPPPEKVVFETQTFGTVTIDHRAHLARRAACKSCHGPGKITKIERFQPKVAHERCVGCHRQAAAGPTSCRDCHVKPEPAPTTLAASAGEGADAGAAGAAPDAAAASVQPGASAQLDAERLRAFPPPSAQRSGFTRVVGLGYSIMGGPSRGTATGPAVYLQMREGSVVLQYAFERGSGGGDGRTLGLLGAGLTLPVYGRWNALGMLLGGFDASESPLSFVPNVGLRTGVEWLGRRASLTLAVTGATDLVRQTNSFGQQIGSLSYSFSASIGYVLGN